MCVQREGKPALKQILFNKYTLDSTKRPWSLRHYLIKTRIIAHHKCGYSFTILHADGIKTRGKKKWSQGKKTKIISKTLNGGLLMTTVGGRNDEKREIG